MVRINSGAWADANHEPFVDEFIMNMVAYLGVQFGFDSGNVELGSIKNRIKNFARNVIETQGSELLALKCHEKAEKCVFAIIPQPANKHPEKIIFQEAISICSRKLFEVVHQAIRVKNIAFDQWYSQLLQTCDKRGNANMLGGKESWRKTFLDNADYEDVCDGLENQDVVR